eukprot:snap_masked-scaffold_3-processed-gene-18.16-mRNA-1 protein AED:1.00 eAED:1.00 QI:0/0/0/0/1/1/4/0/74
MDFRTYPWIIEPSGHYDKTYHQRSILKEEAEGEEENYKHIKYKYAITYCMSVFLYYLCFRVVLENDQCGQCFKV